VVTLPIDTLPFDTNTNAFNCVASNRVVQDHDRVATVFPDWVSILFNGMKGVGVAEGIGVDVTEGVGVAEGVGVGVTAGVAVTEGVGVGVTIGALVLDTV
jgi:hypothetical protein